MRRLVVDLRLHIERGTCCLKRMFRIRRVEMERKFPVFSVESLQMIPIGLLFGPACKCQYSYVLPHFIFLGYKRVLHVAFGSSRWLGIADSIFSILTVLSGLCIGSLKLLSNAWIYVYCSISALATAASLMSFR